MKVRIYNNNKYYSVEKKKDFIDKCLNIDKVYINKAIDFAYNMSFEKQIKNIYTNNNIEETKKLFINHLLHEMGKLGVYSYFKENNLKISLPKFKEYHNEPDFLVGEYNKSISVYSTKHFCNALLLNYNKMENYDNYDNFLLVRISEGNYKNVFNSYIEQCFKIVLNININYIRKI